MPDSTQRRSVSPFRNLFRTLAIALVFIAVLLSMLMVFTTSKVIAREVREERNATYHAYVNSIVSSTESTFEQLMQLSTYLSKDASLIQISLTDSISDYTVNTALQELASFRANNSLVKRLFVCARRYDRVYHDNYIYTTLEESNQKTMVQRYLDNNLSIQKLEYNSHEYGLFLYDGSIFIACDYPLTNQYASATIFIELNSNRLHRQLMSSLEDSGRLYVYDQQFQPVFSASAYPEALPFSPDEAEISPHYDVGHRVVFHEFSNALGWHYLYSLPHDLFAVRMNSVIAGILPVVLATLTLLLVVAFFLARYVHRPYRQLIEQAAANYPVTNEAKGSFRSGLDFLSSTFNDLSAHRTELSSMLETVSDDVLTRLFAEIMAGKVMDETQISSILSNIHSFYQPNAHYTASILKFDSSMTQERLHREAMPIIDSTLSQIKSISDMLALPIIADSSTVIIVLSFPLESAVLNIRRQYLRLKELLVSRLTEKVCPCICERGHIYHSILDLRFSYEEAIASLSGAASILSSNEQTTSDEGEQESLENGSTQEEDTIASRAAQLIQLIEEDSLDSAQSLTARLIEDIHRHTSDAEGAEAGYRELFTALGDELAALPHINSESFSNELLSPPFADPSLTDSQRREDLYRQSQERLSALLAEMDCRHKGLHNRLLVAAQEQIAARYADGSLSLSEVADSIGANASYLSTLFTANLGVKFTEYLNRYRVDQSVRLLLETEETVKDIAEQTGFNSPQQYIRVFKKYKDKSPGQYRSDSQAVK